VSALSVVVAATKLRHELVAAIEAADKLKRQEANKEAKTDTVEEANTVADADEPVDPEST
jgi:hypothetical protein